MFTQPKHIQRPSTYPFKKDSKHFEKQELLRELPGPAHHSISEIKKTEKLGSSVDRKNTWIKIRNWTVVTHYNEVLLTDKEPTLETMIFQRIVMLLEDDQLTAYWLEDNKINNRSFPKDSVTNIVKMLPLPGKISRCSSLLSEITSHYRCPPLQLTDRLHNICIAMGEIFRFVDLYSPKYRILEEEKNKFLISKKIISENIYTHIIKFIEPDLSLDRCSYYGNHLLEGIGRGTLAKAFFFEVDLNDGNLLVIDNQYVVAIDHDRILHFVTNQFHYRIDNEELNNTNYIKNLFNENSYIYFPLLTSSNYKFNWIWGLTDSNKSRSSIPGYSYQLSFNNKLLNEKHLETIKLITGFFFITDLLAYHIENPRDLSKIMEALQYQIQALKAAAKNSSLFIDYLTKYHQSIGHALIFELDEFLRNNRHYIFPSAAGARQQWNNLVMELIVNYNEFLKEYVGIEQTSKLNDFATEIRKNSAFAIEIVREFYLSQDMSYYVKLTDKRLPSQNNELKEPTDKIVTSTTDAQEKLSIIPPILKQKSPPSYAFFQPESTQSQDKIVATTEPISYAYFK